MTNHNMPTTGFHTNPERINRKGAPLKEFSLTEGMREYIAEVDPDKKKERKNILIEKTYQMAMRGDLSAIKEIWNRLEGMPKGSSPTNNIVIPILGGASVQGNDSDNQIITVE